MIIESETQMIEFKSLFKTEGQKRVWKIRIRLIKKTSKISHLGVNWDLMKETQVPIYEKYINEDSFPDDLLAQYWTETGLLNGKITRSIPTYPSAKNMGKKNQRNPLQQAIFEAKAKITKKKEEGFTELDNEPAQSNPRIFPMLAKTYTGKIPFPVFCQPKLDGLRCVCFLDPSSGEVVMQSRTKKDFPNNLLISAIKNSVASILTTGVYLDGELYNHTSKLQTINHYARDGDLQNPEDGQLQYHIYDYIQNFNEPFSERVNKLNLLELNGSTKLVPTQLIQTQNELDELYSKYISEGFEGMIIREPNGIYTGSATKTSTLRSNFLIKRKEVFTDEFPIIGYTNGSKGKDLEAIIWICQTANGKSFKVIPNLSYQERQKLLLECNTGTNFIDNYKRRLLTVEYRSISIDRVPQHGKGIIIRDVE